MGLKPVEYVQSSKEGVENKKTQDWGWSSLGIRSWVEEELLRLTKKDWQEKYT